MPKGKKFDAAEKHFLKQKESLDRTIKLLRKQVQEISADRTHFARRCELLEEENKLLRGECEELRKLHGLLDSDVKALVQKADSVNAVTGLLRMVGTI